MTRRNLLLLILIIAVAAAFVVILYFLFRPASPATGPAETGESPATTTTTTGTQSTAQTTQGTAMISAEALPKFAQIAISISHPVLSSDGTTILYYDQSENDFFSLTLDGGNRTELSQQDFFNVAGLVWSPSKDKALFTFLSPEDGIAQYSYDFNLAQASRLDSGIQNAAFSPDGKSIFYNYDGPNNDYLSLAETTGLNYKNIKTTGMTDLDIFWPRQDLLAYNQKPDRDRPAALFTMSLNGTQDRAVTPQRRGLNARFSDSGRLAAVSYIPPDSDTLTLAVLDLASGEMLDLGFRNALAEKCVFTSDDRILYCAIPDEVSDASKLPEGYLTGSVQTADTFWAIDPRSGTKERLNLPSGAAEFDAQDPFLALDDQILYFVNRYDGNLYLLNLIK